MRKQILKSLEKVQENHPGSGSKSTALFQDNRAITVQQKSVQEAADRKQQSLDHPVQRQAAEGSSLKGASHPAVNKTGLPDQLKTGAESLGKVSLNDVKVHYNSSKPAQLQAHAFAQGNQIHLAPGQERHLPHEAWHVVQQKQGRVKPTTQLKGIGINDDAGLEREADVMGARAINNSVASSTQLKESQDSDSVQRQAIVQRAKTKIPRPRFTQHVSKTIKLSKGQHRRHVVMSSRMREAVWAYHMDDSLDSDTKAARRGLLQDVLGNSNSLRTEMANLITIVHNSMGNLFPGHGGENSAIGFAVNPLYKIVKDIEAKKYGNAQEISDAVAKWDKRGIFGFALGHKKFIGEILTGWLSDEENHNNEPAYIASAIQDFAFTCSFDIPYMSGMTKDDPDVFPSHMDEKVTAQLLQVATNLEKVIENPGRDFNLYNNDDGLGFIVRIAEQYASS